jgi:hypothetical protein
MNRSAAFVAIDVWMAGMYHRRPMLDPQLERIGVGYARLKRRRPPLGRTPTISGHRPRSDGLLRDEAEGRYEREGQARA